MAEFYLIIFTILLVNKDSISICFWSERQFSLNLLVLRYNFYVYGNRTDLTYISISNMTLDPLVSIISTPYENGHL